MLRIAPDVFEGTPFALKGGTAINLFVREMPRLSVDLALVYVNRATPRQKALEEITASLQAIAHRLEKTGLSTRKVGNKEMGDTKLLIDEGSTMVKIEVNTVLRGTIHPVENRPLVETAAKHFLAELSVPVLAEAELYGGKLVAALDRQHPRDLFDVHCLFEAEGLTDNIVEDFVIYLSGHDRPPYEVLNAREKDMSEVYAEQFAGMAVVPVPLEELIETRSRLRSELMNRLTCDQKNFLLSLLHAEPDWSLLRCPDVSELPGIYTATFEVFIANATFTAGTGFADYTPAALSATQDMSYSTVSINYSWTVVPEPSTCLLVGAGLGALLLAGRRKARLA